MNFKMIDNKFEMETDLMGYFEVYLVVYPNQQ